jgi:hypothetical protein
MKLGRPLGTLSIIATMLIVSGCGYNNSDKLFTEADNDCRIIIPQSVSTELRRKIVFENYLSSQGDIFNTGFASDQEVAELKNLYEAIGRCRSLIDISYMDKSAELRRILFDKRVAQDEIIERLIGTRITFGEFNRLSNQIFKDAELRFDQNDDRVQRESDQRMMDLLMRRRRF